jgi:hypothetical protein
MAAQVDASDPAAATSVSSANDASDLGSAWLMPLSRSITENF